MTSVVIGRIQETKAGKWHLVMLNKNVNREFDDMYEAIACSKKHSLGLLESKETSAVSVELRRADKRATFLIWEAFLNKNDIEILEYEESASDYVTSHKGFFKKTLLNRMINERYYSYHDFARVSVLTRAKAAVARIALCIALIVAAFVFLLFGLHAVNMSTESSNLSSNESLILNSLVVLGGVMMLVVAITALISYGYPIYKLRKADGDFDEVDWRKLHRLRNILKLICVSIAVAGIGPMIYFFEEIFNTALWNGFGGSFTEEDAFIVLTIISGVLFMSVSVLAIINTIINRIFFMKNAPKYFSSEEIQEMKLWLRFKGEHVTYKTDREVFAWPIEETEQIVFNKLESSKEVYKSSTDEEIQEYVVKARRRYAQGLEKYINSELFKENLEWQSSAK